MPKRVDARRGNKYHAVKKVVAGIRFDSKAEARRYGELRLLEQAGKINGLARQMHYPLIVVRLGSNGRETVTIGSYVDDFDYFECGQKVIEDVKGVRTPLYRWKKKHFEAQYGILIHEIETRSRRR